ncbi:hypothetical protein BDV28DRAFT_139703 [Aspergillus coremiiformis]|uniref:Uncharacterized protein n=1 Tax=Aspergillus coremiiformis TaxID=138285 RepID=A0A5N6Z0C9_9EURO|nr:hypothetical protein BDV28DRAFT_139703 [Aspergillus coremiiformis]
MEIYLLPLARKERVFKGLRTFLSAIISLVSYVCTEYVQSMYSVLRNSYVYT